MTFVVFFLFVPCTGLITVRFSMFVWVRYLVVVVVVVLLLQTEPLFLVFRPVNVHQTVHYHTHTTM